MIFHQMAALDLDIGEINYKFDLLAQYIPQDLNDLAETAGKPELLDPFGENGHNGSNGSSDLDQDTVSHPVRALVRQSGYVKRPISRNDRSHRVVLELADGEVVELVRILARRHDESTPGKIKDYTTVPKSLKIQAEPDGLDWRKEEEVDIMDYPIREVSFSVEQLLSFQPEPVFEEFDPNSVEIDEQAAALVFGEDIPQDRVEPLSDLQRAIPRGHQFIDRSIGLRDSHRRVFSPVTLDDGSKILSALILTKRKDHHDRRTYKNPYIKRLDKKAPLDFEEVEVINGQIDEDFAQTDGRVWNIIDGISYFGDPDIEVY